MPGQELMGYSTLNLNNAYMDPSFMREVLFRIPMNRLANSDEYQGALIWMLSNASSYLNGAVIPIDGGRTTW